MSTTETQQGGNNGNPPENDGPTAGTSSKKKKNNKSKQKKQKYGNGNSSNGKKFEGSKTSGALKGVTLSDVMKLLDEYKDFIEALILQATVDDQQPEWGEAFKEMKRPKLQELFKRKKMDPVNDRWGEIVDSPMRDDQYNIMKDRHGKDIINRVKKVIDPQLRDDLEAKYKSYNKYIDKKKNSHIAYKKIAVVMIVGHIGPSVKSLLQLSDSFKAASKKNDTIDLLCAIRDTCYNVSTPQSEVNWYWNHLRWFMFYSTSSRNQTGNSGPMRRNYIPDIRTLPRN